MLKSNSGDESRVVSHILKYLTEKKAQGLESIPVNNVAKLVVEMTGVSRSSVMKIQKEGETSNVFRTPRKNRPKMKKKINLNEYDICAIRHKMHEFYSVRKEAPSLRSLLATLKEDINFNGGRESLRLVLQKIGYHYIRVNEQSMWCPVT